MTYTFGSATLDQTARNDIALLLGAVLVVLALVAYLPRIVRWIRHQYMLILAEEYIGDVEAGLNPPAEKFIKLCPREFRSEFLQRAEYEEEEFAEARMHGLR